MYLQGGTSGDLPLVVVSMQVGFHKTAETQLGADNHHKEFFDPFFLPLKSRKESEQC